MVYTFDGIKNQYYKCSQCKRKAPDFLVVVHSAGGEREVVISWSKALALAISDHNEKQVVRLLRDTYPGQARFKICRQCHVIEAIITAMRSHTITHKAIFDHVLDLLSDINARDGQYQTLLSIACNLSDELVVKCVLRRGANPNAYIQATKVCVPLFYAVDRSNVNLVRELLLYHSQVDSIQDCSRTPLHEVIKNPCKMDILQLLLATNPHLDCVNGYGETPLMCAVKNDLPDVTSLLLQHGAAPNILNYDNRNSLHLCAAGTYGLHKLQSARLLVQAGALMNLYDRWDNTALGLALSRLLTDLEGSKDLAKFLISEGSDVNHPTTVTSLNVAIMEHGVFDIGRMALDAGWDITSTTRDFAENVIWDALKKPDSAEQFQLIESGKQSRKSDNVQFAQYVWHRLCNPLDLQSLTRIAIRNHITSLTAGGAISFIVPHLPLPPIMQHFLLFNYYNDPD